MFKEHKKIIISAGILVALIVVYIFLSTSQNPNISGVMYKMDNNEAVSHIEIKNNYGEYTFDLTDKGWILTSDGHEYRTNSDKMELMTSALNNFTLTRILDEENKLYGFDEPSATVSIITNKGNTHNFVVGSASPSGSEAYVKNLESEFIAITNIANVVQTDGSLTAYRDKNVFTIDSSNITQLGFYKDGELEVSVVYDGEGWSLNYPFEAPARSVVMNEILSMIRGWTVAGFPDLESVSQDEMGLNDNSETLMLVDESGNTQVLQFGEESSTARFVRTGGEDDIAMLYTSDIDFSNINAEALMFVTPLRTDVENVSSITVNVLNEKYVFDVNSEAQTAFINGKVMDYDDFIRIYSKYIMLIADGRDESETMKGNVIASMTTVTENGEEINLKLIERDDDTYFMITDDSMVYYMNKERLNSLMERISEVTGL